MKWFSGNNVDSADGIVVIYAETSGGTVKDTSFFFNTGYAQFVEIDSGYTHAVPADGATKFNVYAAGFDVNHRPLVSGYPIFTKARFLTTNNSALTDGCNASMAVIELGSKTLDADYSVTGVADDGIGAVDAVEFRCGFVTSTIHVQLLTGYSSRSLSIFNGPAQLDTGKTADFGATIKHRWGNPLGDHTLRLSATGGTVLSNTHMTDGYGEAYGFRYQAPATAGTQILTLDDLDPRGGGLRLTISVTISAP